MKTKLGKVLGWVSLRERSSEEMRVAVESYPDCDRDIVIRVMALGRWWSAFCGYFYSRSMCGDQCPGCAVFMKRSCQECPLIKPCMESGRSWSNADSYWMKIATQRLWADIELETRYSTKEIRPFYEELTKKLECLGG